MNLQIIPPDPKVVERAKRKRIFYAAMVGIFASAGVALYMLMTAIGCSGTGTWDACMANFNPWLASGLGATAFFVLSLLVAIDHYDD